MQNINLNSLARTIFDELHGTQPNRQVEIIIYDNLIVHGDESLLKIALTNLLGNAWKYTSKMVKSRIEFGNFLKDNETVFFVRDNGAGFPMQHAGKLGSSRTG